MEYDILGLILSGWVFFIYTATCIISLVFTFSPEIYRGIEDRLDHSIFTSNILSPLNRDIDWLNIWLTRYNKITGPVLMLLSLFEMNYFFSLINNFYLLHL